MQNAASSPTYQASVASGDALILPQLKILDSDGVTPILADYIPGTAGYAATCTTPTCADATVTVNASPFGTVPSGGALDVPVVNSAGTGIGSKVGANWQIDPIRLYLNGNPEDLFPVEAELFLNVTRDGVAYAPTYDSGTKTLEVVSATDLTAKVKITSAAVSASITIGTNEDGTITAVNDGGLTNLVITVNAATVTVPFSYAVADTVAFAFDAAGADTDIIMTGTY